MVIEMGMLEGKCAFVTAAGGGIAGLTAAIQLKKVGLDPIVFEKETKQWIL